MSACIGVIRTKAGALALVHWRSKAEALAAAEAFGTMPEVAAFASMIDETQMPMFHLGQAQSFGGR